ncbi:MAG: two component transcriptional regulator, winged helix family [Candidatus Aminicenantes bacterium]|jgi:heavy metal response regulator|nr:two component transcriptional regulator, winged helix family [Candidatus Aminicenantes bacterium]MBS1226083.1 two component transcriptional regulator, winged helix family [Candidatus Aminicenantes bacterium]
MRILVVEDERKIAEFLRKGLKAEGYAVDVAGDGEAGHFMAGTQDYDLMILDLRLPKMDGITLCRTLRAEKFAAPILMLTVRDSVKDKVQGLDSGADDYLTKPFDFEELLARVRALLRKCGATEATRLQVDDLVVDLLGHTASRASAAIPLTAKEFSLLEYLMRNAGVVVSRAMIAEHVWDIHFDSFSNVIDVSVNHLRSKVDKDFPKKLIHTVRGRGYVLKA